MYSLNIRNTNLFSHNKNVCHLLHNFSVAQSRDNEYTYKLFNSLQTFQYPPPPVIAISGKFSMAVDYTSGKIIEDTKMGDVPFFRQLSLFMNIISSIFIQVVAIFPVSVTPVLIQFAAMCTHTHTHICMYTYTYFFYFLHTFRASPFLSSYLVNLAVRRALISDNLSYYSCHRCYFWELTWEASFSSIFWYSLLLHSVKQKRNWVQRRTPPSQGLAG